MSTIAVFVALGGTSYAVARNSIGTPQLKSGAVTSAKVRDGSLKPVDLAPAARTVRGPRGEAGPAGPIGPAGPLGAQEAWRELALADPWQPFGGQYQPPSFRKDDLGQVHLRGLVRGGAGHAELKIAELPPGYRPFKRVVFVVAGCCPDAEVRVDVLADGSVQWILGPSATAGEYTTLDGIVFWPE